MQSSGLYIFWILHQTTTVTEKISRLSCCISFESYIKPQLTVFLILTNYCCISFESYIKPQPSVVIPVQLEVVYLLNPTSNHNHRPCSRISAKLYIFWILHQTTTEPLSVTVLTRCISFESYIKPQPSPKGGELPTVVYLLNPTSNHNSVLLLLTFSRLYIFWILHQTTTKRTNVTHTASCISFESYIKPQPIDLKVLISST